ncbi:hypothetical protein CQ018_07060 [Arthrobacter sp. MYb227]|nr:hypothetical protein CQ018_07060 [Arthrobacter sp. MYb227]
MKAFLAGSSSGVLQEALSLAMHLWLRKMFSFPGFHSLPATDGSHARSVVQGFGRAPRQWNHATRLAASMVVRESVLREDPRGLDQGGTTNMTVQCGG